MTEDLIPFDMGYVLSTTARHMRRNIDVSIRKTFERMSEFDGNSEKGNEVMNTLNFLHQWRKQLDDFQQAHTDKFKRK